MNMSEKYCVYCHINKTNGKKYIGITKQKPERRWRNGKGYKSQIFSKAIEKYGWDNFEHTILEDNIPENLIEYKEQYYIQLYNTVVPSGYNSTTGGEHFEANDELKRRFSESRKGILPKNLDILHTQEVRDKISKALKCRQNIYTSKEVICDNIVYSSLVEFCRLNNLRYTTVSAWMERKQLPYEYYIKQLQYVNEDFSIYSIQRGAKIGKNHPSAKSVICIETKQVYDTITDASNATEISKMSIINCCKGKRKTGGGFHWKYYEEYLKGGENGCEKK